MSGCVVAVQRVPVAGAVAVRAHVGAVVPTGGARWPDGRQRHGYRVVHRHVISYSRLGTRVVSGGLVSRRQSPPPSLSPR